MKETEIIAKKHKKQKLKKGDEIIVISGSQKGKKGKVLFLDPVRDRVVVQGVNMKKRFQRPSQEAPQGGVMEVEYPLHISNVMFYDSKKKKGVRLGYSLESGKKVRVSRPDRKEV